MSFVHLSMHFKGGFRLTKLEPGLLVAPTQPWPGLRSFSAGWGQPTRASFRIPSRLSGVMASLSLSLCSVSVMRKAGSSPQGCKRGSVGLQGWRQQPHCPVFFPDPGPTTAVTHGCLGSGQAAPAGSRSTKYILTLISCSRTCSGSHLPIATK